VQVVIFSGLPGAGKSGLAEAAGRALSIPVFAKDWLEGVLKQHGIEHAVDPSGQQQPLGYIGYELLTSLALRQLQLAQSVILDSVVSTESIRDKWRSLALQYSAQWRVVECVCSDEALHRTRLGSRQRNIPNWPELAWSDVERVKAYYAPWDEERLVVDAVQPFDSNLQAVLAYLGGPA
jgi:predicted kinase